MSIKFMKIYFSKYEKQLDLNIQINCYQVKFIKLCIINLINNFEIINL